MANKTYQKKTKGRYDYTRFAGKIPVAALQLTEDLQSLMLVLSTLRSIDVSNITEDTQFGIDMYKSTVALIQTWEKFARMKLRTEYLGT